MPQTGSFTAVSEIFVRSLDISPIQISLSALCSQPSTQRRQRHSFNMGETSCCKIVFLLPSIQERVLHNSNPLLEVGLMTQLDVAYRYVGSVGEPEMRALDSMREVYGVRRITLNEKDRIVRVEFDASRLKEPVIAGLLRQAGVDIREKMALA
jgi:hypothetical protein